MKYKLKKSVADFVAGTTIDFDPEWKDWEVDGVTYNHRGTISEGEIALLLDALRHLKLTSIMEEIQ